MADIEDKTVKIKQKTVENKSWDMSSSDEKVYTIYFIWQVVYSLARIYFDNAYANAEKLDDFDAYQINTHYARLLLCAEMSTNRNNKERALENFYKAHSLLRENSNSGTKLSDVLRQTGLYTDYYETYKKCCMKMSRKDILRRHTRCRKNI